MKLSKGAVHLSRIGSWLLQHAYVDCDHRISKSVLVSGVGRSGTTWLCDMINAENNMRVLFEPFRPDKVPLVKHFAWRQYLRPEETAREYMDPARRILSGKLRNPWVDRYNRCLFPHGRIIKDIRTNLMLGWLANHFPELRMVVIMRHPCAVAESKLRLGWDSKLDLMIDQEQLKMDYLGPYMHAIARVSGLFEEHVFNWCIEYAVAFHQLKGFNYHLVRYEDLCASPITEMARLYAKLGMNDKRQLLKQVHRPSATAFTKNTIFNGAERLNDWRTRIDPDQVKRAREIMRIFGMEAYYPD